MTAHNEATETWRLYVIEFTEVYTSDAAGVIGQEECRSVFADKYRGRVAEGDYRVVLLRSAQPSRCRLELRLPNLHGEWKYQSKAMKELDAAVAAGAEAVLVERGSAEEDHLLGTLRRRLRDE